MRKHLNVLILDDSESDAMLLLRELKRGGYEVEHDLVDSDSAMRAALRRQVWDIVLSDFSMPSFDALAALQIMHEENLDLPFIIISGTVGEDTAVRAMKAGASDFFVKGKLTRLIASIERELREAAKRRELVAADARFATAFHSSPIGTLISRYTDGTVLDVNARFLKRYGLSREDLVGNPDVNVYGWMNEESRARITGLLQESGTVQSVEAGYTLPSGTIGVALVWAEIIELNRERCVLSMVQDITDRKRAEEDLRASEAKFRLLAENSTDLIARYTPEGVYQYVSPSSLSLLGYTPEEMAGHSAYEYFHPEDLDAIREAHQTLLDVPDTTYTIHRLRRKDGDYVWVESTARTIRDPATNSAREIQSASRDITKRVADEEAIRRYAERLELLHEIDRGILTAEDPTTIAEYVLVRLQTLAGFDSASITLLDVERRHYEILASINPIPNYYPYDDMAIIERLQKGEIYYADDLTRTSPLTPSDESLVAAGIRSIVRIPLISSKGLIGSFNLRAKSPSAFSVEQVEIAREVGAQLAIVIHDAQLYQQIRSHAEELEKKVEERTAELQKSEASLRDALAHEIEVNKMKTNFTSIVSHEFRTPLSVIMSSTETLKAYGDRLDPNRRQEKLNAIVVQVKRLVSLLDDVLMITRSESMGGFKYKPAPLDLFALSESILEDVRVGYGRSIGVEFLARGGRRQVEADEFLFRHILQNLASNAVKYSKDNGTVSVSLECVDGQATLRVQDEGIGIPENDQKHLFEAFHRAANVGQVQGTGIGLTIVKRAVDAHGGSIEFESAEGKGTTFTVRLPTGRYQA